MVRRWTYEHIPRGSYHGYRCAVCVHFSRCNGHFGAISESNYCHRRPAAFERKKVLTVQDKIGELQARMWKVAGRPGKEREFIELNKQIAKLAGVTR